MNSFIFLTLYVLSFLFVRESIAINKGSRNVGQKNIYKNLFIDQNGDLTEENYLTHENKVQDTISNEGMISVNDSVTSDATVSNGNYAEEDLIDEKEMQQIDLLSNEEVMHQLKKAYEHESEGAEFIKHIKYILSRALHIPSKDINLHDMNVLLKKWRKMNQIQYGRDFGSDSNMHHKSVRVHDSNNQDNVTWHATYGYDDTNGKSDSDKINVSYLLNLIK